MRADPRDVGAARDQRLERIEDPVERREPLAIAEPPVRVLEQLLQPLVPLVQRLEERRPGPPTWIVTGTPAAATASHTGSSRSSSGITSAPLASRRCSPRSFQTFSPRAPRSNASAISAPSSLHPSRANKRPVPLRERREPARVRPVVPVEVRVELVAPHAVEVDDRPRRRARPSAPTSSPTSGTDHVPVSQRPRWLCASIIGNGGRAASVRRSRAHHLPRAVSRSGSRERRASRPSRRSRRPRGAHASDRDVAPRGR